MMNRYRVGAPIQIGPGDLYEQSLPIMNLLKLMNDLKEKYPHYFTWVEDLTHYQIIIDGLHAELMKEAMDLDKNNQYATNIKNRVAKTIATLAAMDQHEHQIKSQSESVNQTKFVVLPSQEVEKKSDSFE
jgi:hypothetical protein